MPLYEYKCRECGRVTEVFVKSFHTEKEINCPSCGSNNLYKILSPAAAVFTRSRSLKGKTCCGRDERCDAPPCSSDRTCRRD